jgi:hypothetical protein
MVGTPFLCASPNHEGVYHGCLRMVALSAKDHSDEHTM